MTRRVNPTMPIFVSRNGRGKTVNLHVAIWKSEDGKFCISHDDGADRDIVGFRSEPNETDYKRLVAFVEKLVTRHIPQRRAR